MGFSKTDERCVECSYFSDCDSKRLVACAYIPNAMQSTQPASQPLSQPIMRETVSIRIDANTEIKVYKDELKKQIEKELYKNLQCPFNGFL